MVIVMMVMPLPMVTEAEKYKWCGEVDDVSESIVDYGNCDDDSNSGVDDDGSDDYSNCGDGDGNSDNSVIMVW